MKSYEEFDELLAAVHKLSDKQKEVVLELVMPDGVISLDIRCGQTAADSIAAEALEETITRVGLEESLLVLQSWEGGQRG